MRDLLFKNLISQDKRKRVIASSEVADKEGVHSVIHRHFICMVKEVSEEIAQTPPRVCVVKKRNTKEQTENFFCKIKGGMTIPYAGKIFLIIFMHSLKINLTALAQNSGC